MSIFLCRNKVLFSKLNKCATTLNMPTKNFSCSARVELFIKFDGLFS